jgi:hypothetical protein
VRQRFGRKTSKVLQAFEANKPLVYVWMATLLSAGKSPADAKAGDPHGGDGDAERHSPANEQVAV